MTSPDEESSYVEDFPPPSDSKARLGFVLVFIACTTFVPAFVMKSGRRSGNQRQMSVGFVWLIISALIVLGPGLFVPFPINVLVMLPGGLILGGASMMKQ